MTACGVPLQDGILAQLNSYSGGVNWDEALNIREDGRRRAAARAELQNAE